MSDIFYSQVNKNLIAELNARGKAGFHNRSNKDFDFMLGKVANIEVIPYTSSSRSDDAEIKGARLGGFTTRQGQFLPGGPNGYLADRIKKLETKTITEDGESETKESEYINQSRRTPPYITSAEISIGDHSMGLMNTATIQFIIPNPQADLNFIESTYFRPGRHVAIKLKHPESAVITGELLDEEGTVFATTEKIQKLQQRFPNRDLTEFRKMNVVTFDGQIVSFDLSYQEDMSVQASLSLRGASATYTDVSLLMDENKAPKKKEKRIPDPYGKSDKNDRLRLNDGTLLPASSSVAIEAIAAGNGTLGTIKYKKNNIANAPGTFIPSGSYITYAGNLWEGDIEKYENRVAEEKRDKEKAKSFYNRLLTEYDAKAVEYWKERRESVTDYNSLKADENWMEFAYGQPGEKLGLWTKPYVGATSYKYINLEWVIDFLNREIRKKTNDPFAEIIFTSADSLTQSTYYPDLVSTDPINVILNVDTCIYGKGTPSELHWMHLHKKSGDADRDNPFSGAIDTGILKAFESVHYDKKNEPITMLPGRFFINMDLIKKIIDSLNNQGRLVSQGPAQVLRMLSSYIEKASAGTVQLKLVTHPDSSLQRKLLFADAKLIKRKKDADTIKVVPYQVPMFANHPNGSVVHSFTFSGKLPSDASNLSFVLNQGGENASESDIAPYLAWMYAQSSVTRTDVGGDVTEISGNMLTPEVLEQKRVEYKKVHEESFEAYQTSKEDFARDPASNDSINTMKKAAKKYMKYPTPDISLSNDMASPTIPFTADFTIDGINGLRYGDVLDFAGLPDRYRNNAVFSIVNITHTIDTAGKWTSAIKTMMRIEVNN
jgi:hypothetical protein